MEEQLRNAALEYHRSPRPGKISIVPTKAMVSQRDLSLAYSPGVAAACEAIAANPGEALSLTSRGNLVAVITNGTAVLGLGNIGALAGKPVMEGKACLFKKFAGVDVFDIELGESDPDKIVDAVAMLEPTFGGINLEDIKAPECFYIEKKLRERLKIPVFHDDQHGTAIVTAAALINALEVVGKKIGEVKLVCSGAGAAAIACLDLLVGLGMKRDNVIMLDSKGVIHEGRRESVDPSKARYAARTTARALGDACDGADVFLGLSTAGVLKPEMVKSMAKRPVILALANPTPEIMPEEAKAVRPDSIIATGRSDYPNQVNNVLCFPFMFRGALDVGATTINEEMKLACVRALAELTHAEPSEIVAAAYPGEDLTFGPEYLIPKPLDPRLIVNVPYAVAKAAMDSGVATRPVGDLDAYRRSLTQYVYQTGIVMLPVFEAAKRSPQRLVYAEGEDESVLRAVQVVLDEGIAKPIVIGRPEIIQRRTSRLGLRLRIGTDVELVNPDDDPRHLDYSATYHKLAARAGISPEVAKLEMRRRATLIAAMLIYKGSADAMICGMVGQHQRHLVDIHNVLGRAPGRSIYAAMNMLILPRRTLFICDTYVNPDPTPDELAEITLMAAEQVRRFGLAPKVALLSHSNFGSNPTPSARKMHAARELLEKLAPDLECDGEMHGDSALNAAIREREFPESRLKGDANLLMMPNLDAANISYNLLRTVSGEGVTIGPILLGAAKPAHILTPSSTVRRIVNMSAFAVVQAASSRESMRAAAD
jgi:malate dehydrogenase (oxaloacetate-decarboxylating)(NADP+)